MKHEIFTLIVQTCCGTFTLLLWMQASSAFLFLPIHRQTSIILPEKRNVLFSHQHIHTMHDNNAVAAAAAEHDHDHDHDECSALPKKKIMSSSSLLSSLDRRHFLFRGPATAAATAVAAATALSVLAVLAVLVHQPQQAQARGLVKFPVDDPTVLLNSYHFLRVGDTLLEDEDIWSTNPLFLTNREAALSPTTGIEQMQKAAQQMEQAQRTPGIIKFSLAASCIDSSNVIGNVFNLGRDRIVPEFTFLDPRGIGQWEMFRYSSTKPAVWALDVMEAGAEGTGGRPPANQDGTPVSVDIFIVLLFFRSCAAQWCGVVWCVIGWEHSRCCGYWKLSLSQKLP